MLFPGRHRVGTQATACAWVSAAPSLRFYYRLFLFLGTTFVAFLLATGSAEADDGSGPPDEVSVSSGIESQLVSEAVQPVVEPVAEILEPVVEPVVEPVAEIVEPVVEPVAEIVEPVADPVAEIVAPVVEPVAEVVEPVADPVAELVEPMVEPMAEVAEPVAEVVEPVVEPAVEAVEPSAVPGSPVGVASSALQVASRSVCGGVIGAESVTGWAAAVAAAATEAGAGRDKLIMGPTSVPQDPVQAPTAPGAPGAPSAPCAPGHGPATASGSGGVAPSLAVLDTSDVGAALSADRFAAGNDAVPHSRAALLRTWPG
jgi:hypothetical protein